MRHFILDTNIILRDLSVLGKGNEDVRIAVPEAVLLEVAARSVNNRELGNVAKLLGDAYTQGVTKVRLPNAESASLNLQDSPNARVSAVDFAILKSAEEYIQSLGNKDAKNAYFVTEDRDLARLADSLGLRVLDYQGLHRELKNTSVTNQSIAERGADITQVYKRTERTKFIWGVASGVIGSILASTLTANISSILATINIWGTIIALPILGVLLFWCRSKYRLSYGVAEFIFGVFATLNVFIPHFDFSRLNHVGIVQVVAGLYVIVRGLDNIGTGLKDTRFEPSWKKIFS